ncbi:hypothetical protein UlMin_038607 [Ulmus minor]
MLGKRPRPPIKRTTSMTGITVDLTNEGEGEPFDLLDHHHGVAPPPPPALGVDYQNPQLLSMISPRNHRRNSGDFVETAHFLRTCGLCRRRLASGRDIYMYKGDTAFCSLECREKQMKQDERKEKCLAKNLDTTSTSTSTSKASSGTKSQTVAAA